MLLWISGVRILILSRQKLASASSRRREIKAPWRSLRNEHALIFSAIDHSGKMPSAWRPPATRATLAFTAMPGRGLIAAAKIASSNECPGTSRRAFVQPVDLDDLLAGTRVLQHAGMR